LYIIKDKTKTIGEGINLRVMIFSILQSKVGILKPFSTWRLLPEIRHQSVLSPPWR